MSTGKPTSELFVEMFGTDEQIKEFEEYERKWKGLLINSLRIPADCYDKNYVDIEVPGEKKDRHER